MDMANNVLKDNVFLTATDTTIGFISQNAAKLTTIKARSPYKHYIKAVNSLSTLRHITRIPTIHKKRVRRAKRTTFILPNGHSYRVINDAHHRLLLDRLTWAYTTSANISGKPYDPQFAKEAADILVFPLANRSDASTILKLGTTHYKRIR